MLVNFIYEHFGRHIAPGAPQAWATTNCLYHPEKKSMVSLRGPGKYQLLIAEAGVWVKADKAIPPEGTILPPHIQWVSDGPRPRAIAMRNPKGLGRWYGVTFGNQGWESSGQLNRPANSVFTWYEKSGSEMFSWNHEVITQIGALQQSIKTSGETKVDIGRMVNIQRAIDADDVMGVSRDAFKKYQSLTQEQKLAVKKLYLLLRREVPDAVADGRMNEILNLAEEFDA